MVEPGPRDEMREPDGTIRPGWSGVAGLLDDASVAGLRARRADTQRLLADDGVAYLPPGAERAQPWGLDPLPLVVEGSEWNGVAAGVAQRAELGDRLLADLYGPRTLLDRGVLPVEVVEAHPGYLHGWRRPADVEAPRRELFLAGVDLGRSPDGWVVLDDRVQAPSGAGYALANRRVVSRVLSGLHRRSRIRRLRPFFDAMRVGLPAAAPAGTDEPRVVLLHPGPDSETAYEQALLASQLGIALVRGSELTVRSGRVWQHSLGSLDPVDVILRRLDAQWCDPLDLRPDSVLGVAGLVEAARIGTVSILNGLGSEVVENPGLAPFLPAVCRELLGEELALASPQTWWCGDPTSRRHVLARMDELLLMPIARGAPPVRGAGLSRAARAELRARIEAEPYAWVGRREVELSTSPALTDDGVSSRPVALRAFAVASGSGGGSGWEVLDGGLAQVPTAQVPTTEVALVVTGADTLAKDVWIVGEPAPGRPEITVPPPIAAMLPTLSPRVAEDFFWLGRYAVRAEDTARLLRAVGDRWADFHASPEPGAAAALDTLLRAVTAVTTTAPGFGELRDGPTAPEVAVELNALLTDRERPGTLGYAVHRLTRAALAVREQLSPDTWLVLGRLDDALEEVASHDIEGAVVSDALNRVLEGLLALNGIVADSLVRDTGWQFLDAGRRVERAQQIVALVTAALGSTARGAASRLVSETVLIAAESVITHRRRHPQDAATGRGIATLLDLLLLDRDNPRALAFQLVRLDRALATLPHPLPSGLTDAVAALAGVDVFALSTRAADGSRPALVATLATIGSALHRLADEIAAANFAPAFPPRAYDPLVNGASTQRQFQTSWSAGRA